VEQLIDSVYSIQASLLLVSRVLQRSRESGILNPSNVAFSAGLEVAEGKQILALNKIIADFVSSLHALIILSQVVNFLYESYYSYVEASGTQRTSFESEIQ